MFNIDIQYTWLLLFLPLTFIFPVSLLRLIMPANRFIFHAAM